MAPRTAYGLDLAVPAFAVNPPASRLASPRAVWLAAVLVAAAIGVAWSNSFTGPFVLDDIENIPANETVRSLRHALAPPSDLSTGGRPILNLSFALNYAIGGASVRGYHAANLAIHILAALTLLGLVRRTLLTPRLRARYGRAALPAAAAAALVWALHPLQTASVTYVSQRAESLMALFYLLVLYCLARAAEPGASRAWLAGSVFAGLLGVGTKEVIVTVPLVALLYDRTFLAGSFRAAWRQRRALYAGLALACAPLAWLMRGIALRGVGAEGATPLGNALVECRVLLDYLKLVVWPHPLVFDYGQFEPEPVRSLVCGLVLVLLLAATALALVRRPALGFLGAWFFLVLAPTSSFVPVTFQPMGENRMYLPLAAVAVAAALGAETLWRRRLLWPLLALLVGETALTVRRNQDYRDPVQLWAGTLALRPDNYRAQNEYALSLAAAGRSDEAIASIRRALARRPDASTLQRNLGLLLVRAGRTAEALPHFEKLVQLQPTYVKGHQEYAHALAAVGRLDEAMAQVRLGIRLLPQSAGPHLELGRLLMDAHRPADALGELQAAVRLAPDDATARNELATTLLMLDRGPEALRELETAVRLDAHNATLHFNLGRALLAANRARDALPELETAARLQPASAATEFALANTLATLDRLPEAMPHYERTLQLDPNLPQAREFYEQARAHLAP